MGNLVAGDDGLPVEEVGGWIEEKHDSLRRYISISRSVRAKWLGDRSAGATYIDLFCGPGRAWDKDRKRYIDGSCVAAWKASLDGSTPFSQVVIADLDDERRAAAATRLKALGAPVLEIEGSAVDAASELHARLHKSALHFAFLDPFNLRTLDFKVIKSLAGFKYIDMLIHVSQMDHQRNWAANVTTEASAFDAFAPGWMNVINIEAGPADVRNQVFQYWRGLGETTGAWPSTEMKLIRGSRNQPLYWLLMASKHELAHKFWAIAANPEGQGSLF